MNKTQKMVKAIIYPLIVIVITIGVSGDLGKWLFVSSSSWRSVNSFDFNITWPFWVIALIIIYKIEEKIFSTNKTSMGEKESIVKNNDSNIKGREKSKPDWLKIFLIILLCLIVGSFIIGILLGVINAQ
jgi:hypothetical protein